MTIDFFCEKCEASFEMDAADLIDGTERIKCPNCDVKLPQGQTEDFGNALGELCKQMAAMSKKFEVSLALESDDLPPPYDREASGEEEDEEEDEDADEDLDEDEESLESEDEEEDSY